MHAFRALALVSLAGCYCHGGDNELVKLKFEVANPEALRDASAVVCWTAADDSDTICAQGLLGVGRSGALQFDRQDSRLWTASAGIATPDPAARGSLLLSWSWPYSDRITLSDGDRYAVTIHDAAGNTVFDAQRTVSYRKHDDAECGRSASVEETLP